MWNHDKTIYEFFNIEKDADKSTIKKVFISYSKKYHPDKNPNNDQAEKMMKLTSLGYEILSDEQKRQKYDLSLEVNTVDFEEVFGGFTFNRFKPSLIQFELLLSLAEIYSGGIRSFQYTVKKYCDCERQECMECNGTGKDMNSFFSKKCSECNGTGFVKGFCSKCAGEGHFFEMERVDIDLKKLVGLNKFRLKGLGHYNKKNKSRGDVIITIKVKSEYDNVKKISDYDLELLTDIYYFDLILGGKYNINIFNKTITINIPENSNYNDILRLKGLGLKGKDKIGDLYVKFNPLKSKFTEKEIEYLKLIRDEHD